ncbi:MAG: PglZ domain-containing protein [Chloroherpetonaceae bacterium]|nr:PglZ domain-containing protein [Chloroherpetonaceae bacterium]MDW8436635.1 bifunctional response regulator/alkaline phosphatase family protein [Chloroherpetonaceae bacterium]
MKYRILWADDEIDYLRPHILFLSDKGYEVTTVTSGEDAVQLSREQNFDIVFLDEQMPGIGGLDALSEIKTAKPALPVVMITKNEQESIMEQAIGKKISEYLIKPVNPTQILLACKKLLDAERIKGEAATRDYISEFNRISRELFEPLDEARWKDIFFRLSQWEVELDEYPHIDLRQTLLDQKRECNAEFGKFIEKNYRHWIHSEKDKRPMMSVDVLERKVLPELNGDAPVFLFVVDCLRYDQWLVMEKILGAMFQVERDAYFSILPTATPYARNAIFSGLFPLDMEKRHPDLWKESQEDESTKNRYEPDFMQDFFSRRRIHANAKYAKLTSTDESKQYEQNITSQLKNQLNAVVVNFVDILAHSRSDMQVIKELSPDEAAYRSLTQTWFEHSAFLRMLRTLSKHKCVVLITTDHGAIRCLRHTKVIADREASTNLRYKFGRNLQCEPKHAVYVKNPNDWRLPQHGLNVNYIIAKEDYYFVYPTNFHKYVNQYKDSFQHGGISLDEVVVPMIRLTPKI